MSKTIQTKAEICKKRNCGCMIDEFIAYCEEQFGVTVIAEESENPDTFEKIFGDLQTYRRV